MIYVTVRDRVGHPIGIGQITNDGHIGHMAVLASWRQRGQEQRYYKEPIAIAQSRGLNRVWLDAQLTVTRHYIRHGFISTSDIFQVADIAHQINGL